MEHDYDIKNEYEEEEESSEREGRTGKKPRGSRFRGVSRNGNQWQV